ncbi:fructose-1,6-bisphosphatase class 2 [Pasteurella canis]|uniref:fructose-bisphosphatase n=1 Tax=Pasteurella canis TaxID=753 RepID=A0A379ESR3_9PAST|nr:fructose-1,6-bisphosphatase class 2 [Pasteurella canis]
MKQSKKMQQLGVKVLAIPDGDVAASILCCLPDGGVDMLYGIGGAPEGVIAAAAVRALGGEMQARLLPRHQVKGNTLKIKRLLQMKFIVVRQWELKLIRY